MKLVADSGRFIEPIVAVMPPVAAGVVQLTAAADVAIEAGMPAWAHTLNCVLRWAAPAPISAPFADVSPTLPSLMR